MTKQELSDQLKPWFPKAKPRPYRTLFKSGKEDGLSVVVTLSDQNLKRED